MEFWYVLISMVTVVLTIVAAMSLFLIMLQTTWNSPLQILPILAIILFLLPMTQSQFPYSSNGKVCIHYPQYAEENMDPDWKETFLFMMNVKSFTPNSIIFMPYDDMLTAAVACRDNCFADFWLLETGENNATDITTAVAYVSHDWQCSDMNVNLYFYAQQTVNDFFVGTGDNCSMSVCLLDPATTLGKGCLVTDDLTYEPVSGNKKSAVVDVADTFTYRLSVDSVKCSWRFCTQGMMRTNVFVLTMGNPIDIDDQMQTQQAERVNEYQVYQARIQWREWWNLFYKLVEIVNKVISSVTPKQSVMISNDDVWT